MSTTFDEVSMEQFDEVTFLRRIAHDPTTAAWPKIGFFSGLQNQSWWTDIKFWCQRVMYMLTFWRSAQQGRMVLAANRNPRIFWRKYRVLLQMLDGMDMQQIFEAVLVMHQLSRNLCDRLVPDENAEELLEPKSVHDFIAEEVEPNRFHFIEHFLVLVPTNFMHTSVSWQWKEILSHHKEWRTETSKWAKFSRSLEEEFESSLFEMREHIDSCIKSARQLINPSDEVLDIIEADITAYPAPLDMDFDDEVGGAPPPDDNGDMILDETPLSQLPLGVPSGNSPLSQVPSPGPLIFPIESVGQQEAGDTPLMVPPLAINGESHQGSPFMMSPPGIPLIFPIEGAAQQDIPYPVDSVDQQGADDMPLIPVDQSPEL